MVTIDHPLENGNIVDIVTSPNAAGPSIDWLKIAKSSSARNKIRQWLKKENKGDTVDKGKDTFAQYLRRKGYDPRVLMTNNYMLRAAKELGFKDADDLYNQLSYGGNLQTRVANKIQGYEDDRLKLETEEKNKSLIDDLNEISEKTQKRAEHMRIADAETGVVVEGVDNLMISIARCCTPVPGDEIVGYITKGRGITVHRTDCDNMKALDEEEKQRLIEVSWDPDLLDKSYDGEISIIAKDQKGLLSNISKVCEDMDVRIVGLNARANKDETVRINLTLMIHDRSQIEKICRSFKGIPGILEAYRNKG